MKPRINLNDTTVSALVKMADGNPSAISAMMAILEKHQSIDPQAALGGIGTIMMLDEYGIYGSSIYVLYSDKCDRDVRKMLMLMRAVQLGIFSKTKLQEMAADQRRQVNLTDAEWQTLDDKVCERLDDFARPTVAAS